MRYKQQTWIKILKRLKIQKMGFNKVLAQYNNLYSSERNVLA